jgi:hypothetical protein
MLTLVFVLCHLNLSELWILTYKMLASTLPQRVFGRTDDMSFGKCEESSGWNAVGAQLMNILCFLGNLGFSCGNTCREGGRGQCGAEAPVWGL